VLPLDPSIRWVSSTLVRHRLEQSEPVDDLVPSAVAKFLAKG
jgi:nicotinic acid mononucleotide adenylyltransferase